MKNTIAVVFILLFVWSCTSNTSPTVAKAIELTKVDELAQRYLDLGRFSGTILIAQNDEIAYHKNFGYANHDTKEAFTAQTAFKVGALSELFIPLITNSLSKANAGRLKDANVLEQACINLTKELTLDNIYYLPRQNNEAKGHLHINPKGEGLRWVVSAKTSKSASTQEIKSTAKDVLKLLQALPEKAIQKDGYMNNDAFSYAIDKSDAVTIIILSNAKHPIASEMTKSIKAIMNEQTYELPLPRKAVQIDTKLLTIYAGKYALRPDVAITFVAENDTLYSAMGPEKVPLIPQSDNQFYLEAADAAVRFVKGDDGSITKAIMYDGFLTGNEIERIEE